MGFDTIEINLVTAIMMKLVLAAVTTKLVVTAVMTKLVVLVYF